MRRTLLQSVLRMAGLVVLLFGAAGLAVDFMGFLHLGADDHAGPTASPQDALDPLGSGRSSMHLLLFGGILYVLPAAPLSRRRRVVWDARKPIDFQATFGPHIVHETVRRRILRWGMGLVCLLVGLCLGLLSQDMVRRAPMFPGWGIYGAAWLFGVAAPLLLLTSWRLFARRAESVLRRNRRRPVLYLRSFKADVRMLGGFGDLFRLIFFGGVSESPERALTGAVVGVGPLVAVGRPHEKLPPLGAARLYVRTDWQAVVAGLAQASDLVVFRIGQTAGFWWEIGHVVAACDPRRVLIYLPKKDRGKMYADFREQSAEFFPQQLPFRTGDALFLGFDADWNPRLLGRGGPSVAAGIRGLLGGRAPVVREALNKALRPLGLDARPLPWRWRESLMLIVLVVLLFQCCLTPFYLAAYHRAREEEFRRMYEFNDK